MKKLVIFDLDGTLLDTIADLAESTNVALRKNGFPVHPVDAYRFFVGNGINKLFERALPEGEKTEENILLIRKDFLVYYNEHNTDKSQPYPGVPQLLSRLQQEGVVLAVASNKYHTATVKLIHQFFPEISFAAVLGQREGVPPKPDPVIVSEILQCTGIPAGDTLYIGDSGVDMQTAINAGVESCGVTWGFRPRTELAKYSPNYIVDAAEEILPLVI